VHANNASPRVEGRILLGDQIAPRWHWGVNLVLEHEIAGADRENEYAITEGVSSGPIPQLSIGAELRGEMVDNAASRFSFDNVEILAGPSIQWRPLRAMNVLAGGPLRCGVGDGDGAPVDARRDAAVAGRRLAVLTPGRDALDHRADARLLAKARALATHTIPPAGGSLAITHIPRWKLAAPRLRIQESAPHLHPATARRETSTYLTRVPVQGTLKGMVMSGNFSRAYSHVGPIHAAFAGSPRRSEYGS
jgi:hypothetical protein